MGKRALAEREIRSQYIRPEIVAAGWKSAKVREEHYFTAGRTCIIGHKHSV
jgi:type I site-specific restriction endonuclease